MARKGGGRRGPQQSIKGFRPGKAPVQLKKQHAKAQLSDDATWVQKQTVEAVAGRSPQEVHAMVRKWSIGLFVGGGVLAVAGTFLYGWAIWAGVVVHVLAAGPLFLGFRVRKQGAGLAELARSLR
jgi:hypothetical protein